MPLRFLRSKKRAPAKISPQMQEKQIRQQLISKKYTDAQIESHLVKWREDRQKAFRGEKL